MKIDGWKILAFPFGVPNLGLVSGAFAVRECKPYENWQKYRGFTGVIFRPEKGGVISPYLNSVQKALYISVQRKHGLFIKKDILYVFIW